MKANTKSNQLYPSMLLAHGTAGMSAHVHFHPPPSADLSFQEQELPGTMLVELYRGVTLQCGAFAAVIAPDNTVAAAFSSSDLRRYRTSVITGPGYGAPPAVFETYPEAEFFFAGNAKEFLAGIRQVRHTIVFVGHDPAVFSGVETMILPAASALADAGKEALVLLHSRSRDPVFTALARHAARRIELIPPDRPPRIPAGRTARVSRAQARLGVR